MDRVQWLLVGISLLAAMSFGFILGCKATAISYPCVAAQVDGVSP